MSKLKVICAWCGKNLGEKDGEGVDGITHGICEDCRIEVTGDRHHVGLVSTWLQEYDKEQNSSPK